MINPSESGVYAPEDLVLIRAALDRSMRALSFAFPQGFENTEANGIRRQLAERILSLAAQGERDMIILSNTALAELPPLSSGGSASSRQTRADDIVTGFNNASSRRGRSEEPTFHRAVITANLRANPQSAPAEIGCDARSRDKSRS
jgi:hypothetical protein